MEQLLYAASHDLREPIRMVTSFLDLLQKRASAGLDEEARDYVQFACEGAKRMKSLVGGLLELSRIRAHAPEFIETDITAIVENVLQDLNAAVLESHARIIFGELPVVRADPILFYSLMQNLLSNALKFHGEKAPEIELSARRNADEWIFSVRDNGIGFEPQYAGAVFETFRRLHNREFFPGNGLGLALAREIVTLHKGRIWVSSALGQGADFQFTLPVHL